MSMSSPLRYLPRVKMAVAGSSPFTTTTTASPSSKPTVMSMNMNLNSGSIHTTSPGSLSVRSAMDAIDAELELGESVFGSKDSFKSISSGGNSITGITSDSVYSASPEVTRARSVSRSTRFGAPLTQPQVPASETDPPTEFLPALAPLDALMTSNMGWTNVDPEIADIATRAMADVYGEPRPVKADLQAQPAAHGVTVLAPAVADAVSESVAAVPVRDLATEEAALWAAAKQCHTEDFDDAYIKERQRRRQESDGRPTPPPPRPVVNRAELFAAAMRASATDITHVFYEAPTVSTVYDCDRSPQCRVPPKPEQEKPAPQSNSE